MIPIMYDKNDPNVQSSLNEYYTFISHFKKTIDNAIKRGYIGHKKINQGVDSTKYLIASEINVLKWISAHIKFIADLEARYMKCFIHFMETHWQVRRYPRIHDYIHHLFVNNGYDGGSFPKDALVKAVNIDTCPYCNRQTVGFVELRKIENGRIVTKSLKGQLDHFYNKELYPYLAISRNNLVPSCASCNEYPNKYTEDAVATGLVNPYEETNPNSLLFRIEDPSIYSTFILSPLAKISFNMSANPNYNRNIYTFGLDTLYNRFHIKEASIIYKAFRFTQNNAYQTGINSLTSSLQTANATTYQQFKEFCGVVSDESEYKKVTLSKMKTDIWNQLEQGL